MNKKIYTFALLLTLGFSPSASAFSFWPFGSSDTEKEEKTKLEEEKTSSFSWGIGAGATITLALVGGGYGGYRVYRWYYGTNKNINPNGKGVLFEGQCFTPFEVMNPEFMTKEELEEESQYYNINEDQGKSLMSKYGAQPIQRLQTYMKAVSEALQLKTSLSINGRDVEFVKLSNQNLATKPLTELNAIAQALQGMTIESSKKALQNAVNQFSYRVNQEIEEKKKQTVSNGSRSGMGFMSGHQPTQPNTLLTQETEDWGD